MTARQKKADDTFDHEADAAPIDSLAQEVANALRYLGGAAHRDRVVDCIGAFRRQRGESVDPSLRPMVIKTFERHCADWSPVGEAMFFLPYGPGSHRWALTAAGRGRA